MLNRFELQVESTILTGPSQLRCEAELLKYLAHYPLNISPFDISEATWIFCDFRCDSFHCLPNDQLKSGRSY
ncbi:hypothetical protein C8K61_101745 [Pseudomonas sp. GV071]|nr:hypothetical protein C8K61_101745 [Pseudomonas sp. GV071]